MSGNNDNKDLNYNSLPKKEQENVSAQKAGQLASKTDNRVSSEPNYKNIKNTSIPNEKKNKEEITSKKIGDIDKATGGKVGRIGNQPRNLHKINNSNENFGIDNKNNTPEVPTQNGYYNSNKPNFAKNGINNDSNVPNGNSEGANKNRLREIFNKKKEIKDVPGFGGNSEKKSFFDNKNKNNDKTAGEYSIDVAAQSVKQLIKKSLLPFFIFVVFILLIMMIIVSENSDKGDAIGGDYRISANGIETDDEEQKAFYERVTRVRDEYKKNGKDIDSMYITATYHIIKRYNEEITYEDMTEEFIKELADGMLGSSTTYSKETYSTFLRERVLPKYLSSSEYDIIINDIFEYIDDYVEDVYGNEEKKSNCYNTTGGSCRYTFNGVHGLNTGAIDLSNIQVRLMSSSNCPGGTDNVVLDENLIPFEEYILGVGYGELGPSYNQEAAKVHFIAARSFALSRPYYNRGVHGVKLIQESNKNIIQLRNCAADQVFCNTKTGCSVDYDLQTCNCQPMVYSGTEHKFVYIGPLNNQTNSNIKKLWEETMGMVAVDKEGKVVIMPYARNYQRVDPQDPAVWVQWATERGWDYKRIILEAYPNVVDIKQASCNNTTESDASAFLRVAKEIWTEITNTFKDYTNGNQVPPTTKTIDCSTYVDWVLYKYGYEDFKGYQKTTNYFYNTNLNEKYGWTEIPVAAGEDVTSKLKPGDILVRHVTDAYAHMNIIVEIREDGSVWGYDCGGAQNWKSSRGGKVYNVSSFVKYDDRPGKIIRVTNNGTGDTCETAESGEWSEWRQINAPWSSIPLGVKGDNIGTIGCYVTSLAIQIARSGAQTTISNFNPGTFVNEIKKTPGAFSDGGGLNWAGENSISNFVPGFKIVASHVALGRTKEEQISTIKKYIDEGYYVTLNLDYGRHWVAVMGTSKDNIQMQDPGRNEKNVYDVYPPSSIVKINVYSIK